MNNSKLFVHLIAAALMAISGWTLKEVIELKVAVGRLDARFCDHVIKSQVYESNNCNTLAQRP